jgi:hypothetical protein
LAKQDDTARRELRDLLAMLRDALGQPPLGTLPAAMAIRTIRLLAEQDLGKRMAMREQMKRLAMEADRWDCGLSTAVGGLCPVRLKGVHATRARKGGAYPDAIAALVLLATRYPVAQRQPRSQDAPGCAPGSRKGGRAMRRQRTTGVLAVLGALLVVVLGATAAAAQAPVKVTETIDETIVDEFLSEECGVPVTTTITGRITFLTFPDDESVGPQILTTLNFGLVATAGDNQVRFRDVGIDLVRVAPDGTVILSVVGQVPFGFTGVLKVNLDTGDVILEPHHDVDTTRACELLTA